MTHVGGGRRALGELLLLGLVREGRPVELEPLLEDVVRDVDLLLPGHVHRVDADVCDVRNAIGRAWWSCEDPGRA